MKAVRLANFLIMVAFFSICSMSIAKPLPDACRVLDLSTAGEILGRGHILSRSRDDNQETRTFLAKDSMTQATCRRMAKDASGETTAILELSLHQPLAPTSLEELKSKHINAYINVMEIDPEFSGNVFWFMPKLTDGIFMGHVIGFKDSNVVIIQLTIGGNERLSAFRTKGKVLIRRAFAAM